MLRAYDLGVLLFFVALQLTLYWRLSRYKQSRTAQYTGNIAEEIPKRSWHAFITRSLCLVVAWSLLYLAYVESGSENEIELSHQTASKVQLDEVAFFLDVSSSMNARDSLTGMTRLEQAKEVINTIIENLGSINISLNAFAGDTQKIISATEDYLYFRILLESLNGDELSEAGTSFSSVVEAVKKEYVEASVAKSVLLVLLTDGEDTNFLALGSNQRLEAEAALVEKLRETASDTLQWDVVGLGTEKGAIVPGVLFEKEPVVSSMQPAFLKQMAQAGRGKLYIEQRTSASSITDNILTDIFSRQKVSPFLVENEEVPIEEPKPPYEALIGALLLILAALSLPERVLTHSWRPI